VCSGGSFVAPPYLRRDRVLMHSDSSVWDSGFRHHLFQSVYKLRILPAVPWKRLSFRGVVVLQVDVQLNGTLQRWGSVDSHILCFNANAATGGGLCQRHPSVGRRWVSLLVFVRWFLAQCSPYLPITEHIPICHSEWGCSSINLLGAQLH